MTERTLDSNSDIERLTESHHLYPIGELPPLGEVPEYMYGQLIRSSRLGKPETAFELEIVKTPHIEKPNEVIIAPMAMGINHNLINGAEGNPMNFVSLHRRNGDAGDEEGFHIGGSDASGIVYAVGKAVNNVKVGDHVVAHCAMWNEDDQKLKEGVEPSGLASFTVWGLDVNWGSLAQFSKVQSHQLMPKAEHLTWEEAAVLTLDGATAYKMFRSWPPHTLKEGSTVLIWGGSGGLGSLAIQIAKHFGARPFAVVSSPEKGEWCKSIGAEGYINRTEFDYWKDERPSYNDRKNYDRWLVKGPGRFKKALEAIIGTDSEVDIVFEYTGEDTLETSMHVCKPKGMVVICAGLTGYKIQFDLLRFWPSQKTLQGSHVFNDQEANEFNNLVRARKIKSTLSPNSIFAFNETGLAHQKMADNTHEPGKMAVLVNANRAGLGAKN